jgi:transcription initiation factor IIE alpha subunit
MLTDDQLTLLSEKFKIFSEKEIKECAQKLSDISSKTLYDEVLYVCNMARQLKFSLQEATELHIKCLKR